ncbi:MAG: RNA 2',3'-cyclic phosphodiesterase [Pyrinomonadaceae bacterium]
MKQSQGKRESGEDSWRVFCAIELPRQTRLRLLSHIEKLQARVPELPASWSRESNIHLTLKFLGETPQQLVRKLDSALTRAIKGIPPFPILISGSGVFPRPRDPRVLWVGISDLERQLANLHSRIEAENEQEGFAREARQFHPHLTLARLRTREGARDIARAHEELQFAPEEITVNEVLLIRSELSSQGSRYSTISKHVLDS